MTETQETHALRLITQRRQEAARRRAPIPSLSQIEADSNSGDQWHEAATSDSAERSRDPRQLGICAACEADGRGSRPTRRDCCQAAGQHRFRVDSCGMSAQRTDRSRQSWTTCLLLRIRRFGVRVPPSAPPKPQVTVLFSAMSEALGLCLGPAVSQFLTSATRSCESWRARPGLVAGPRRWHGRRSSG